MTAKSNTSVDSKSFSPWLLRLGILMGFVLLALPINRFVTHTSQVPVFLGRYSRGFFLFLLVYIGAIALAGLATWYVLRLDNEHLAQWAERLGRLFARKPLSLLILIVLWLLLISGIEILQEYAPGRSAVFQFSSLAFVILLNLMVSLAGRPAKEAPTTLASLVLVLMSIGLSLGAMEFILRRFPELIPDVARPHLAGQGRFVRQDLIFDKPVRVGYRWHPLQDKWVEYRKSSGDLYRHQRELQPIDPEQDIVLAQVHFITDENGYPNQPPLLERYNVVATGDSFSVPGAVAEPWPMLLGQLSGQSVLNLAIPGYSPQSEVEAVKLYGLTKYPAWIIVGYFEGNDLIIEAPGYEAKRASGLSWIEHDLAIAGPYRSSVALQTLRYGLPDLVGKTWRVLQPRSGERNRVSYRYPLTVTLEGQEVSLAFFDPYLSALTAKQSDIEISQNYKLVSQTFLNLKRESDKIGAQLLMVYIPSKGHVYLPLIQDQELWRQTLEGIPAVVIWPNGYLSSAQAPPATVELTQAHPDDQRDVMAEFARHNGIHFLDLTPDFQAEAAQGAQLYYMADTHWNQHGHDLAARLITDYLTHN